MDWAIYWVCSGRASHMSYKSTCSPQSPCQSPSRQTTNHVRQPWGANNTHRKTPDHHKNSEQTRTWSNNKDIRLDLNFNIKLCHMCRMCIVGFKANGTLCWRSCASWCWSSLEDSTLPIQTSEHLPLVKLCSYLWKVYRTFHKKNKELLWYAPKKKY